MSRGPLTYFVEPGQVTAWLKRAPARARLTYAIGPNLGGGGHATASLARDLKLQGLVDLTTERSRDRAGCTNYIVVKSDPVEAVAARVTRDEARVLGLLSETADRGERCPSYAAIADALDLIDRQAARYLFHKLTKLGAIRVVSSRPRCAPVIEIAATGKQTAS